MKDKENIVECQERLCISCLENKSIFLFEVRKEGKIRNQCKVCRKNKIKPKIKPTRKPKHRVVMVFEINGISHKICRKCKQTKDVSLFNKCLNARDGLDWQCKKCKHDTHYLKHKERYKKEQQNRRQTEEYRNKRNSEHRIRYKNDSDYKLLYNLRGRVKSAFSYSGNDKDISSLELFGAPMDMVKNHISSKFDEYMSWENYLNGDIHIDHTIPCEAFDLSDKEQQKACFHYTNLQPLWAADNLSKIDKLDDGRYAHSLTREEKLIYLKSKGHDFTKPSLEQSIPGPNSSLELPRQGFADSRTKCRL